jgi:putative transposase
MPEYRHGSHSVYEIRYLFVWLTKYRSMLGGARSYRLRELIKQTCDKYKIEIIKGNIRKDHVHMLGSCPQTLSLSQIMKYVKGRTSRMMQNKYREIRKRYWRKNFLARGNLYNSRKQ